MTNKTLIAAVLAALSFLSAMAPADAKIIRRYTEREGLHSNRVTDILQDTSGFIWICNRNALSRFDGKEFVSYSLPQDGQNTYLDNICLSPDGKLWVASTLHIFRFDPVSEQFVRFSSICPEADMVCDVRMMSYDSDGVLWFCSTSGVYSWDERKGRLKQHFKSPSFALLPDLDTLWLADHKHLMRYDEVSDTLTKKIRILENDADRITVLHSSGDGYFWIGTWEGRLFRYDTGSGKICTVLDADWPSSLKASRIHDIHENSDESLILATDSGLLLFNKQSGSLSLWEKLSAGDSFYRIVRDREGGIWIATYFNGIEYISPQTRDLELYTDIGTPGSLRGSAVSDFCEDESGNVWISTENGGLNYFNTKTHSFTDYSSVSYNNIHTLLLDSGRYLWMGTFSHGLERMNLNTGKIDRFRYSPSDTTTICDDHVYSICDDSKGNIYVATLHGMCRYDKRRGIFFRERTLGRNFFTDVFTDSEGSVWAASTSSGIWRKDGKSGEWTNFHTRAKNGFFLQTNRVNKIMEGYDGIIYAASHNAGILYYSRENGEFRQYGEAEGFPAVTCYGILQDSEGNLWVSSDSGILKYSPQDGLLGRFSIESGMQGNMFNLSACRTTSDGKMWFGGVNGFNCFDPLKLKTYSATNPPVITSVTYNTRKGEVRKALPSEGPVLHWKSPSLSISFCSTDFAASGQVGYAWRMEGYSRTWTKTSQNTVSIYNIRPGRHVFEVRTCGRDGVWSEAASSLTVTVLRNPLLRWWAVSLYALFLFTVVFLILRVRTKEKNMAIEKETIQAKIDFFSDVAHEIKTPLTLIKAPLEQVISSGNWDRTDKGNLDIIQKNTDRLIELVCQLLDFRKIDKTGFEIRLEDCDPCLLVTNIVARFQPVGSEIRIVGDVPEAKLNCKLDKEAVTKILSNLMMNALKFAKSQILVSLRIEGQNEKLVFSVSDDGPGIPEKSLDEVFEPFFQIDPKEGRGVGIGLSLVKLLSQKHQGEVHIANNSECGCRVCVTLPFIAGEDRVAVSDPLEKSAEKDTILIVEDTPDMLDFLSSLFSRDWVVRSAENGAQAMDIIEREQVDFILSDYMMPKKSGLELLQEVRKNKTTSALPFVLISAKDDTGTKVAALECGADAYLEKPFSSNQLTATVNGIRSVRRKITEQYSHNPESGFVGIKEDDAQWLKKIDSIILDNLDSPLLCPDVLISRLSIGKSAFQKRLKALTGLSAGEYIKVFRLKKAASLLRDGRYRVGEISYMVGFSDQSYFTKCFIAQFGILPKEYAKKGYLCSTP